MNDSPSQVEEDSPLEENLSEQAKIDLKQLQADAFLSLHCNSADSPTATGTETYYRDATDRALALRVQGACVRALGTKDRGLKRESDSQHTRLAVLDFDGPACLLELAFLSNAVDRARLSRILTDRDWRLAVAAAIAEAIEAWWRQ